MGKKSVRYKMANLEGIFVNDLEKGIFNIGPRSAQWGEYQEWLLEGNTPEEFETKKEYKTRIKSVKQDELEFEYRKRLGEILDDAGVQRDSVENLLMDELRLRKKVELGTASPLERNLANKLTILNNTLNKIRMSYIGKKGWLGNENRTEQDIENFKTKDAFKDMK